MKGRDIVLRDIVWSHSYAATIKWRNVSWVAEKFLNESKTSGFISWTIEAVVINSDYLGCLERRIIVIVWVCFISMGQHKYFRYDLAPGWKGLEHHK